MTDFPTGPFYGSTDQVGAVKVSSSSGLPSRFFRFYACHGPISPAAFSIASMIFWYPVQRHKLPEIPPVISGRVGCGLRDRRSMADITIPGVHMPHWIPTF